MLKNRRVVLGITGGIAAYKAADLARCLIRKGAQVNEKEKKLAEALVAGMSGDFHPEEFHDSYREAVVELLKKKTKGEVLPVAKPVPIKATVDIMDALEKSVKAVKVKVPPTRIKKKVAA